MHPARDTILARIPTDLPYSETARSSVEAVFGIAERLAKRKADLDADPNLSPAGQEAALAAFVTKGVAKNFADATRPIRKALSHVEAQRAGFKVEPPDRTDHVAEMRRQEIRTYVRNLPLADRFSAANDPIAREAVLDAPVVSLSGLPADRFKLLADNYIAEKFGAKLSQIEPVEDVYVNANSGAQIVRKQLQEASGLKPEAFEEMMQPLEAAADA